MLKRLSGLSRFILLALKEKLSDKKQATLLLFRIDLSLDYNFDLWTAG
jgi:hypothetical protein